MPENQEAMPLTEEQEHVLDTVFDYRDGAELTEDEQQAIREMFDTPDKLRILRKVLGIFTQDERGLTIPDPKSNVSAESYEQLGREVAIQRAADEKVRGSLLSLYQLLRQTHRGEKKAEFEAANREQADEEKRTEEHEAEQDVEKRAVGPNV